MGWGMVRNPGQGMPSIAGASHQFTTYNPTRPILGGIAVSLSNPYWSLWWATVGATFMNWSNSLGLGLLGLASFYFGHILADYAWYGLVSLGIASGRRFMTDAVYRGLILACGLFLWIMAGYFLYSGATRLL
jgi:threonine/homoserine/homoserine lactone efflux protein